MNRLFLVCAAFPLLVQSAAFVPESTGGEHELCGGHEPEYKSAPPPTPSKYAPVPQMKTEKTAQSTTPTPAANLPDGVQYLIDKVNEERSKRGLSILQPHPQMMFKCQDWAEFMAAGSDIKTNYYHPPLSQNMPEGYAYASENIGWNSGNDYALLHTQWITSDQHRKNMLNRGSTHIGVGIGRRVRDGKTYIYGCEVFAEL